MSGFDAMQQLPQGDLESIISNILNGQRVTELNDYLMRFVETDAAWQPALSLFQSNQAQVRYFAANIIYTKIRKHWTLLNETQQQQIYAYVLEQLDVVDASNRDNKLFMDRIMLCLSCICCKTPGGVAAYVDKSIGKIQSTLHTCVGLEMLCTLPGELEIVDAARTVRLNLEQEILQVGSGVLVQLNSIAASGAWEEASPAARALHALCMKALRGWLSPLGVSLTSLAEDYGACLRMVCGGFPTGDTACVTEACLFLREVTAVSDYPRRATRDAAVMSTVASLTGNSALLAPFFDQQGDFGDDRVAYEICNTVVSVACNEVALLSGVQSCPVDFFKLLLSCSNQRPRKIAALTFEAWISLQDIPVADRHPFVAQEVFLSVLQQLLSAVCYPGDYTSIEGWDNCSDDEDDFLEFRTHKYGLQDVVLICCYALPRDFFDILARSIASAQTTGDWKVLEAVLLLLYLAMEAVRGYTKSENNDVSMQFMLGVVQLILSPEVLELCREHVELEATVSRLLGSATFLLTYAGQTHSPSVSQHSGHATKLAISEYYLSALTFLFSCLVPGRSCESSSRAINMLCANGKKILTQPRMGNDQNDLLVFSLARKTLEIMETSARITDEELHAAILLVIEGVVRAISALSPALMSEQLCTFAASLERAITEELRMPTEGVSNLRVQALLSYAGQIVRFADSPSEGSAAHVLEGFLACLWPKLTELEKSPFFYSYPPILKGLFDFYGRALRSAGPLTCAQVPAITQTLVGVFHEQSEASSSALQCATVIVEMLAQNRSVEFDSFLGNLLHQSVEVLSHHANSPNAEKPKSLFGYDPECIGKFFRLIYQFLLSCSDLVAENPSLPQLCQLITSCLIACQESGPLRLLLQVCQTFYCPQTHRIEAQVHYKLLETVVNYGEALVMRLFAVLAGGGQVSSALWTNIIDTLHSVICGCQPTFTSRCQGWVQAALADSAFDKLGPHRQFLLERLFLLAVDQRQKFKALALDLCRVCVNELEVDALLKHR